MSGSGEVVTVNRSSEELAMRDLVVPELRKRYPSARIIHELPLRYSSNRIDLAAVTEAEIVSVEIKSSVDVADRLEAQLRAFLPVSSRLIVALAPKWNEKLPYEVSEHVVGGVKVTTHSPRYTPVQAILNRLSLPHREVWTVSAEAGTIDVTDSSYRSNLPWLAQMLHMLHVEELADIAGRHRCWQGKRPVHLDLVRTCSDLMTGREIIRAVCAALRARDAFAEASDAPIVEVGQARTVAPPRPASESPSSSQAELSPLSQLSTGAKV